MTSSTSKRPATATRAHAATRRPATARKRAAPRTPRPAIEPAVPGSIRDQVIAFKREQIINAAVELFYEHGYQRTTLDAVAQRLEVTKPFIYYHFKDKEEVLVEISRRSIIKANEALADALEAKGSPMQRLHQAVSTVMRAVIENRRYTAIYFREQKNLSDQSRAPLYEQHRRYDKLLVSLLREGQRKGEFVVDDPGLCALAISGMTGWAYNWYASDGRLSAESICTLMADMALRLVGASPERLAAAG